MGVKVRINRGKLFLDIYVNGKRTWEALHLSVSEDKKQNREIMHLAEICRSKREAQIVSGEWGLLDPVGGKKSLYAYLDELGKGRNRRKDRVIKVQPYLEKYPGGTTIQIGQITDKWFSGFQEYLLKESGLSKSSANSYAAAVRMALKKAVQDGIIPRDPSAAVKTIPVPEADKVFLSSEEIQRLASTPMSGELGADVRRAFLFACFSGLRISDIKSLTWGNIEHNPLLFVKRQKKTGNKAFIPLHETAWQIINDGAIHAHTELVFPRLGAIKSPVNEYLTRWAERAGLEKHIGWHTARHTFAVLSLENGADIYTVSKLLGHTNLKTTEVYAKATDKMKREAVNALPAVTVK
jgi:integrase